MTSRAPGVWQSLSRAWDGPAVTWTGLLLLAPGILVTDIAFTLDRSGQTALDLGASLAAYAALVAVIQLGNSLLLRRRSPGLVRRLLVLLVFAAGATVRIIVLVTALPGPIPHAYQPWMAARFASTLIWLNAAAILVDWQRHDASQLALRNVELQRLEQTTATVDAQLQRTTTELAELQRRVIAEVDQLQLRLDEAEADLDAVADGLSHVVDGLVRPTSHHLARVTELAIDAPTVPLRRPSWREQAGSIGLEWPTAMPFQPVAVMAITLPIAVAAIVAQPMGLNSIAESLAVALQLGAVAALSMITPAFRRIPRPVSAWLVGGLYAALAMFGGWLAVRAAGPSMPVLAEVALLPWIATVSTGGAAALSAHRGQMAEETEQLIGETQWQLNRAHQQLWAQRRRLAVILHGRVQASLTACELLLRQARRAPDVAGRADALERVRTGLRYAVNFDDEPQANSVTHRIEELARTWTGVIDVEHRCDFIAAARLAVDRDANDAIMEAVRELVLNAVRHGTATRVGIHITPQGARTIRVAVTEPSGQDERTMQGRSTGGLGLALLESLALTMDITSTPSERTTTVVFATAR